MIYVGDKVKLTVTFRDFDGELASPSAVTLKIDPAGGTVVTKTISDLTSPSTGVFYYEYTTTVAGPHRYSFEGTSGLLKYEHSVFEVSARPQSI